MALLVLKFPKMRVLWSRSPAHTAELFLALKKNKKQPDRVAAAAVGSELKSDAGETETSALAPYVLHALFISH
jgi:DNA excision repair protein ERCC-4